MTLWHFNTLVLHCWSVLIRVLAASTVDAGTLNQPVSFYWSHPSASPSPVPLVFLGPAVYIRISWINGCIFEFRRMSL